MGGFMTFIPFFIYAYSLSRTCNGTDNEVGLFHSFVALGQFLHFTFKASTPYTTDQGYKKS